MPIIERIHSFHYPKVNSNFINFRTARTLYVHKYKDGIHLRIRVGKSDDMVMSISKAYIRIFITALLKSYAYDIIPISVVSHIKRLRAEALKLSKIREVLSGKDE